MSVKITYKNRRSDVDRRKRFSNFGDTDRRRGVDRRKLDEKLKHLIDAEAKDQHQKTPKPVQKRPGNVIIRRKGEKNQPSSE